jgi:hypothetical protein
VNSFASQFGSKTPLAQSTNPVGDNNQIMQRINQETVLIFPPTSAMGASRHRKLRRHHVAMDRES